MTTKHPILIVEDDPVLRSNLNDLFEFNHFKVFQAANGIEALKLLRTREIALVLTDWMMVDMNGIDLTKRIKSAPDLCHIPVIILTAKVEHPDLIFALQTGADDYVVKPFSSKELFLRCRNAINSREAYTIKFINKYEDEHLTSREEDFVKKFRTFLHENYHKESLSIKDISSYFNMGQSNFQKTIKRITGKSTFDLLIEFRLLKARDLLSSNSCSVSEAAFRCGFKNTYFFTRKYKKFFGTLPSKDLESGRTKPEDNLSLTIDYNYPGMVPVLNGVQVDKRLP